MGVFRLGAGVIALLVLAVRPAAAVMYSFATPIAGDSVPTTVTLTDAPGGNAVDITVSIPAGQGDLLGFFGNVTPETLVPQLSVACTGIVTQFQANANKVSKVGPGNVMTPVGAWDWGVRLGQNGSGGGAITTASFRIQAPGLDVANLTGASTQGWVFGVRIQSTLGLGPEGSAKLGMPLGTPPVGGPPTIAIGSPANGALLGATPVSVTGSFTGTGVSIQVNGVAASITGSSYSASVPLVEGANTLTATATNASGTAAAPVSVTLDTTPPVVTITAPAEGSVTAADSVVVTGTVVDASPIASFTVNGQSVALVAGAFSTSLPLALGANPIVAAATDAAGNSGSDHATVTRGDPPSVEITFPAEGFVSLQTPVTVTGAVSGTAPLSVTVNGVVASVSGGSFSAVVPLSAGANVLSASAANAFGSASDFVEGLLGVCQPGEARPCYGGPAATEGVGVCSAGTQTCRADASAYGSCAGEVRPAPFEICADALDNDCDGAVDGAEAACAGSEGALDVEIDSPPDGARVRSLVMDVIGRVTEGADSVTVNGTPALISGGYYLAPDVLFSRGDTTLTAVAALGSAQSSATAVVHFGTTPDIVITSPATGSIHRSGFVDVRGVVDASAAFVDVNGVLARIEPDGRFFAPEVPLVVGSNTLVARAVDLFGAQAHDQVDVVRDDAAPLRVATAMRIAGAYVANVEDYRRALEALHGDLALVLDRPIDRIPVSLADNGQIDVFVFTDSADPNHPIGLTDFEGIQQGGEPIPIAELSDFVPGRLPFEPVAFQQFTVEVAYCPEGCEWRATGFQTVDGEAGGVHASLEFFIDPDPPTVETSPPGSGVSYIAGNTVTVTGRVVDPDVPVFRALHWEARGTYNCSPNCFLDSGTVQLVDGAFVIPDIELTGAPLYGVYVWATDLAENESAGGVGIVVDPNTPAISLAGGLRDGATVATEQLAIDLNFAASTTLRSVNGVADGRSFPAGLAPDALLVDLALGLNTFELEFDTGGSARTFSFSIVRVAELAPVTILSPQAGARVGGSSVRIVVSVPFGTPGVNVNGVAATATSDPRLFERDVPLQDGPMTIEAITRPSGERRAISITADTRAPSAWILLPRDGTRTVADTVAIGGMLTEAGSVILNAVDPGSSERFELARTETQREIGERSLELLLASSSAFGPLPSLEPGSFGSQWVFHRFALPPVELYGGLNEYELVLRDRAGNERSRIVTYLRSDTALALVAPEDGSTTSASHLNLELEALVPVVLESVFVGDLRVGRFNGLIADPGPLTLGALPLRPGMNHVRVSYRREGAAELETFAFSIRSEAPAARPLLRGRITAQTTGSGISGAIVEVLQGTDPRTTTTASDGSYALVLEPGAFTATVRAQGYASREFSDTIAADEELLAFLALSTWAESPTTPLGSGTAPVLLAPPSGAVTDFEALTVVGRLPAEASSISVNGVAATLRGRNFEARAVPLAPGANTLRAVATYVDGRSDEASVSVTRAEEPELIVRIFSPPSSAVVPGGGLVVRGFVSARDARVLVGAGGFAPVQHGLFTVPDVFPPVGSSQVEAAAQRAAGGTVASHAVPVSVQSAEPALVLTPDPAVGEPALTTTLELAYHVGEFPISRIDFDLDGDGQLDRISAPTPVVSAVLPSARRYEPRAWVATPSGVELSAAARVRVELPIETDPPFAAGNPVDLAPAGAGDVYVLDRAAATLSRYDQNRQLVSRFGSAGMGQDQLLNPEAIAIGPGPRIYVADTGNDRIQVFRTDGTWERTIGSSGSAPGQLDQPRGLEVRGDELIVADAGNARVQVLALDGTPRRHAPIADPRGVAEVLGAGVVVAAPATGPLVLGEGGLVSVPELGLLPQEAALGSVVDVAAGEGLVVLADSGANRVVVLDDDLRLRRVIPSSGAAPIAVLPSARREVEAVYVADGSVVREVRLPVPSPVPVVQALRARLLVSDIPGALALIHPLQRSLFDEIYHDIETDLPVDAAGMGAMRVDLVRGDRAMVRMETEISLEGRLLPMSVPVHLSRAEDGTWQIVDY